MNFLMSTSAEACCICAVMPPVVRSNDEKQEQTPQEDHGFGCCGRVICSRCLRENSRFSTYCPFCQISFGPSPLPQGTREPPSYSPPLENPAPSFRAAQTVKEPPPYSEHAHLTITGKSEAKNAETSPDVLHFVDPNNDSVNSLSLRYGVPVEILRRTNGLFADHLIAARRAILIPGEYYKGGVSLSPRPLEGEEEEIRKSKVRRFMVACKVVEYAVALIYLHQSQYNLDEAIKTYQSDEAWEREHPLERVTNGQTELRNARRRG